VDVQLRAVMGGFIFIRVCSNNPMRYPMKGENLGEFEEIVMLAVRSLRDDATGASIQELLERQADRSATLGAIYAALDRGHRKGLVDSWLGDAQPVRGGRRRRHYAVTAAGEAALGESRRVREALWRAAPESAG
jgi:DNA-binding PadR family transcriptional regulator